MFRHALLQEAVYDDLLPGERTRLHGAFARTLEAAATADGDLARDASLASELAYHWYAAHDLPRAFDAALRAADAAEASYAFPEALALYERALELWDRVPEMVARTGRDRVEVMAAAAGVARFSDPARAAAHPPLGARAGGRLGGTRASRDAPRCASGAPSGSAARVTSRSRPTGPPSSWSLQDHRQRRALAPSRDSPRS